MEYWIRRITYDARVYKGSTGVHYDVLVAP